METIKEGDDEDNELEEGDKLIESVKSLEDIGKPQILPNLTRKSTFPRNFSTMSFMAPARKRRGSKDSLSLVSSYSRLDFTGSSLQLHLEVIFSHDSATITHFLICYIINCYPLHFF